MAIQSGIDASWPQKTTHSQIKVTDKLGTIDAAATGRTAKEHPTMRPLITNDATPDTQATGRKEVHILLLGHTRSRQVSTS